MLKNSVKEIFPNESDKKCLKYLKMKATKEIKIMLRQESMGFITPMTISSNVESMNDFTFSPEKTIGF